MKEKLNCTIEMLEMLLEINKSLVEQLEKMNKNYEMVLERLQELQGVANDGETLLEKTVTKDIAAAEDEHVEEPESAARAVGDVMADDLDAVTNYIGTLKMHAQDMYTENDYIYGTVQEIYEGYNRFIKQECELGNEAFELDDAARKKLSGTLINQLGEYGWANKALTIYAYSQMDKFKYKYSKDIFVDLYKAIRTLYEKYNIDIFIPKILEDVYDTSEYEYSNDNYPQTEYYCNITPSGNLNKIYDLIKVGYAYKRGTEEEMICKPEIFCYQN